MFKKENIQRQNIKAKRCNHRMLFTHLITFECSQKLQLHKSRNFSAPHQRAQALNTLAQNLQIHLQKRFITLMKTGTRGTLNQPTKKCKSVPVSAWGHMWRRSS